MNESQDCGGSLWKLFFFATNKLKVFFSGWNEDKVCHQLEKSMEKRAILTTIEI
jgi:hypothetical protein